MLIYGQAFNCNWQPIQGQLFKTKGKNVVTIFTLLTDAMYTMAVLFPENRLFCVESFGGPFV